MKRKTNEVTFPFSRENDGYDNYPSRILCLHNVSSPVMETLQEIQEFSEVHNIEN